MYYQVKIEAPPQGKVNILRISGAGVKRFRQPFHLLHSTDAALPERVDVRQFCYYKKPGFAFMGPYERLTKSMKIHAMDAILITNTYVKKTISY